MHLIFTSLSFMVSASHTLSYIVLNMINYYLNCLFDVSSLIFFRLKLWDPVVLKLNFKLIPKCKSIFSTLEPYISNPKTQDLKNVWTKQKTLNWNLMFFLCIYNFLFLMLQMRIFLNGSFRFKKKILPFIIYWMFDVCVCLLKMGGVDQLWHD